MPAERRCGVGVGSSYMIRLKEYVFGETGDSQCATKA